MLELLITLLVVCLVAYVVFWLVGQIGLPEPFRTVVLVVLVIILILWLVQRFGLMRL